MRGYGFIAHFTPHKEASHDRRPLIVPSGWRTRNENNFTISAKPFPTTPEADLEVQPIKIDHLIVGYQGRCDNRGEVAEALSDYSLATAADGTVFASAYEAWGTHFADRLNGEYCFAICDQLENRLVAGRGPIAAPSLYYMPQDDGSVLVTSELSVLLKNLSRQPDYDELFFAEYWADIGSAYTQKTPYCGVTRLLPNQVLTVEARGIRTEEYFSLDPERVVEFRNDLEYEEQLRHLLLEAVRGSLRCNGRIFAELSGGLDSSTIVCLAAELDRRGDGSTHGLSTISYGYSQSRTSDEEAFWKLAAEQSPFEAHIYDMDSRPPFTRSPNILFPEPDLHICNPAFEYLLGEWMPERGGKVVIKGIAGDEVLSGIYGFPVHLSDYLRNFDFLGWLKETNCWYRNRREFKLIELLWTYSFEPLIRPNKLLAKDDRVAPAWLSPDYAREYVQPHYHHDRIKSPLATSRIAGRYHSEMISHLEPYRLHEASQVEGRLPLAYRPLVEFMLAVPWSQKINSTYDRWLQRRALREILPEKIRTRIRKTYNEEYTLRGIRLGWRWIEQLLDGLRIATRGYVDPSLFKTAVLQLRHGVVNENLPLVVNAINLEVWLRTHEMAHDI